jgi:hypothetical protein
MTPDTREVRCLSVVPAYNEETTLAHVVEKLPAVAAPARSRQRRRLLVG